MRNAHSVFSETFLAVFDRATHKIHKTLKILSISQSALKNSERIHIDLTLTGLLFLGSILFFIF